MNQSTSPTPSKWGDGKIKDDNTKEEDSSKKAKDEESAGEPAAKKAKVEPAGWFNRFHQSKSFTNQKNNWVAQLPSKALPYPIWIWIIIPECIIVTWSQVFFQSILPSTG